MSNRNKVHFLYAVGYFFKKIFHLSEKYLIKTFYNTIYEILFFVFFLSRQIVSPSEAW